MSVMLVLKDCSPQQTQSSGPEAVPGRSSDQQVGDVEAGDQQATDLEAGDQQAGDVGADDLTAGEWTSARGTPRQPAFSTDGDFVIGGAFFLHLQMHTAINNYTTKPKLPRCKGRSTAIVVVAFTAEGDMRVLLEELNQQPPPPRQWIGSEGWITDPHLMSFSFCAGAIGVAIQQAVIPGLRNFLLDLSPSEVAASSVLTEFWEDAFNCSLINSTSVRLLRELFSRNS
ncbi:hypothetical protein ILYODFUR_023595 [Ilyodon furcidens]|uniref:Receptor ligand binding region domain-containing protein n=1 Tax=Ilyodon furcidens TaxID=33524 RepID=A0ABV0VHZ3_9TELE